MNMLRACYDWRVLTALAALGIGIYFVAPGLVAAALPLLVLAACPLSMLLMMKAMGGQQAPSSSAPEPARVGRVAALREELETLGRRQEQLAEELRAIAAAPSDDPDVPLASATPPAPEEPHPSQLNGRSSMSSPRH